MSLGRSEVTEPLFDDRGERTSKPKSSRLDAALGRLETMETLRSDELGVGIRD